MKITEMYPKKYATGEDLQGKQPTLEIARIVKEAMHPQQGAPAVAKFVLYFKGASKGVVLSKTLAYQIAAALGKDDTDLWPGCRVQLHGEPVTVAGQKLNVVRAAKAPNGPTTPPPAMLDEDDEDPTGDPSNQ